MRIITVKVTLGHKHLSFETKAYETYPGCPLVITRPIFEGPNGLEAAAKDWRITHAPTGMSCGGKSFSTRAAAAEFIARCKPREICWLSAKTEEACRQCYDLYKAASD